MILKNILVFSFVVLATFGGFSQKEDFNVTYKTTIKVGAERVSEYLPLLKGKKVGIVANHTSVINKTHLVDSLLKLGVNIVKVFSPEHGFRGTANAGEKVKSSKDIKTGLPIVSLYGKNKKPTKEQVKDLDVIIFDIQDVGARFYTYISTMHYIMESASENGKEVLILDRPNPNGFYIDGPVLESKFKSFVGMHPIPVVHGLTVGELAKMINGENWLKNKKKCKLKVIKCENYTHKDFYKLPIAPSPNLPNMSAIYLYPSLCFFEGTSVSVGRGTDFPFQVIGSPFVKKTQFSFVPKSNTGSKNPKHKNKLCNGYNLSVFGFVYVRNANKLYFNWLIAMNKSTKGSKYITRASFFDKLAGNDKLRKQIEANKTEEQIRDSWQKDLDLYKVMRKKYLLYKDFN